MASERADSSISEPLVAGEYSQFPKFVLREGRQWYRAHLASLSPWWFSNHDGRFNLVGERGTLNAASSCEVSVREVLGPRLTGGPDVPAEFVAGMVVSALPMPALEVADFLHSAAAVFGVVAGDVSGPVAGGYGVTRAWARRLDEAGFEGIRSRSRFGAGSSPTCLYVFGAAGEHPLGEVAGVVPVRKVVEQMDGYRVARPRRAAHIDVKDVGS